MPVRHVLEELAYFFRNNYKELGLPDDFGSIYEGGKYTWSWGLELNLKSDPCRAVEFNFYPNDSIFEIKAKVYPRNFSERYRSIETTVGLLKSTKLDKEWEWIAQKVQQAVIIASASCLLHVDIDTRMFQNESTKFFLKTRP